METTTTRNFVRTILPWVVAAGMLLVYLATLDKVMAVTSIYPLARATGADWRPVFTAPLSWLMTLPIRALPAGLQLLGMNFIGALCAALSLALLARCVSILPHDRTQLQRDKLTREDSFLNIRLAWVPVLFAVLVCGLQRSFWENATVGTGEALDLLLFAYCVRCVLEYRIEEDNRWLYKLALVYGLGITNNFAMIAFFPTFLVALVWVKGLRFFRFDFLARMFLLGLAGLSLYLLLPVVQSSSETASATFWQVLKANLSWQKHLVWTFRKVALLPAIYALLPLLLMGIRWPSSFGDQSPVGSLFANAAGVVLHVALLVFCLYIAFDPPISPREVGAPYRAGGYMYVFLPCYFLGALIVGYYSGFLLLVFSQGSGRSHRGPALPAAVTYAVTALVCGGALFVVGRLVKENYPRIRESTSHSLHDYASALAASLPEKPAVILSDDVLRLYAVNAALPHDAGKKHLFLDTGALNSPAYHRFLRKRYGTTWPTLTADKDTVEFSSQQILQWLAELGNKGQLTYLHPSFGYYFETYYLEPNHLVYSMKPYLPNAIVPPAPSAAIIDEQASAWNTLAAGPLKQLKATIASLPADRARRAEAGSVYVAGFYSRALDWWGVDLQTAGKFDEAVKYFDEAIAINPDNVAALINRDANIAWRKNGQRLRELTKEQQEKLKLYPGIDGLLNVCGPVDQPDFAIEFARIFTQSSLFRQAGQMVHRALAFAPDDLFFQATLANVELLAQQPDRALEIISRMRTRARTADPALQIEVARIEAFSHYAKKDFPAAERILKESLRAFPDQDASYNALSQLYVTYATQMSAEGNAAASNAQMTNALNLIEGQVKAQPQNASAHFNYGALLMFVRDFDSAIVQCNRVLELQKDNSAALLNRAMANFQSKKFDAAKRDYQEMVSRFTTTDYRVYYGLGEIAYQQKDWKAAKEYYQKYLRFVPPNAGEAKAIRERLGEVKKKA